MPPTALRRKLAAADLSREHRPLQIHSLTDCARARAHYAVNHPLRPPHEKIVPRVEGGGGAFAAAHRSSAAADLHQRKSPPALCKSQPGVEMSALT